jgi:hypothetical protein
VSSPSDQRRAFLAKLHTAATLATKMRSAWEDALQPLGEATAARTAIEPSPTQETNETYLKLIERLRKHTPP